MHPRSLAVQPERSEAKSKAGPPTLRLRRWRGYAQSERENNPGYTQVKTAIGVLTSPLFFTRRRSHTHLCFPAVIFLVPVEMGEFRHVIVEDPVLYP